MKTIFRIMIILMVASMIGGAFYVMVGGGNSSNPQPAIQNAGPDNLDGIRPEGRDEAGSFGSLPLEMLKNLLIISIIATVYINANKLFGRRKVTQVY